MYKIIISPYSQKLPTGMENPKNYPYWPEVLQLIKNKIPDVELIQIGVGGEVPINGVTKTAFNLDQIELLKLTASCDGWISVDNFFQHFCNYYNLPRGIVLFSQSDPTIFGYKQNINLLKDKKYLKRDQFLYWWHDSTKYIKEAFVEPEIVLSSVLQLLRLSY